MMVVMMIIVIIFSQHIAAGALKTDAWSPCRLVPSQSAKRVGHKVKARASTLRPVGWGGVSLLVALQGSALVSGVKVRITPALLLSETRARQRNDNDDKQQPDQHASVMRGDQETLGRRCVT